MRLLELRTIPEALPFFITPKAVDENSVLLQQLPHWAPCSVTQALEFLTPPYKGHPRVMAYVLRVLETYPPETVTFFMPQLVQSLRYDEQVRILSVICMFLLSMMIREISVYIFFFIITYRSHIIFLKIFWHMQLIFSCLWTHQKLVEGYLLGATRRSNIFAHILIWHLQVKFI